MAPEAHTELLPSGVYFIRNIAAGTVMDLDNYSSENGTKIQGYSKRELYDHLVGAQLWIICRDGNENVYTIQNARAGTFMDLNGANVQPGTRIQGWQGNGTEAQRWKITRNSNNTAYVIQNMGGGSK